MSELLTICSIKMTEIDKYNINEDSTLKHRTPELSRAGPGPFLMYGYQLIKILNFKVLYCACPPQLAIVAACLPSPWIYVILGCVNVKYELS